jgi:hypothetical protein
MNRTADEIFNQVVKPAIEDVAADSFTLYELKIIDGVPTRTTRTVVIGNKRSVHQLYEGRRELADGSYKNLESGFVEEPSHRSQDEIDEVNRSAYYGIGY